MVLGVCPGCDVLVWVVVAWPGCDVVVPVAPGCDVLVWVVVVCPGCPDWVVVVWVWIRFGCAAARCGKIVTAAARPGSTVPAGTLVVVTLVVRDTTPGATSITGPACRQVLPGPTCTLRVIRVYSVLLTVIRLDRQSGSLQPQSGRTTL